VIIFYRNYKSIVKLLQVIMTATRVVRRGCRERLNSSAPYRHKHELRVTN